VLRGSQNAKAVLGVVEGDPLDAAGEHLWSFLSHTVLRASEYSRPARCHGDRRLCPSSRVGKDRVYGC
jgi:hypothetical protein